MIGSTNNTEQNLEAIFTLYLETLGIAREIFTSYSAAEQQNMQNECMDYVRNGLRGVPGIMENRLLVKIRAAAYAAALRITRGGDVNVALETGQFSPATLATVDKVVLPRRTTLVTALNSLFNTYKHGVDAAALEDILRWYSTQSEQVNPVMFERIASPVLTDIAKKLNRSSAFAAFFGQGLLGGMDDDDEDGNLAATADEDDGLETVTMIVPQYQAYYARFRDEFNRHLPGDGSVAPIPLRDEYIEAVLQAKMEPAPAERGTANPPEVPGSRDEVVIPNRQVVFCSWVNYKSVLYQVPREYYRAVIAAAGQVALAIEVDLLARDASLSPIIVDRQDYGTLARDVSLSPPIVDRKGYETLPGSQTQGLLAGIRRFCCCCRTPLDAEAERDAGDRSKLDRYAQTSFRVHGGLGDEPLGYQSGMTGASSVLQSHINGGALGGGLREKYTIAKAYFDRTDAWPEGYDGPTTEQALKVLLEAQEPFPPSIFIANKPGCCASCGTRIRARLTACWGSLPSWRQLFQCGACGNISHSLRSCSCRRGSAAEHDGGESGEGTTLVSNAGAEGSSASGGATARNGASRCAAQVFGKFRRFGRWTIRSPYGAVTMMTLNTAAAAGFAAWIVTTHIGELQNYLRSQSIEADDVPSAKELWQARRFELLPHGYNLEGAQQISPAFIVWALIFGIIFIIYLGIFVRRLLKGNDYQRVTQ